MPEDTTVPEAALLPAANVNVPPRHQPIPNPARLMASHQRVRLRNTDEKQVHIFLDRFGQAVELRPGQTEEADMVVDEIQSLIDQRRPGRGMIQRYNPRLPGGLETIERPPHPVVVEGFENPAPVVTQPESAARTRAR